MKKYFILLILALFACKPDPPEPPDPYLFQAEDFIIDEGVSPQVYYENDGIMFYSQGMAYQNIDINAGDYQVFLVCQQWTPDDENVMLEIVNPSGVLQIEVKSDTLTYITFYVHLNESKSFYAINFSNFCWCCRDYFLGGCILMACGFMRRDICKECRHKILTRDKN